MTAHILRMDTMRGEAAALVAARHNKREIAAELGAGSHIDPSRTGRNVCLLGLRGASDVSARWHEVADSPGAVEKRRRNTATVVEVLFSLPRGAAVDVLAYFRACLEWAVSHLLGGHHRNVIGADVHQDEGQPHMHVLVVPFIGGRWCGSALLGDKSKMKADQDSFHREVAAQYGLKPSKRLAGEKRKEVAASVIRRLERGQDPVTLSSCWPLVRDRIKDDPGPWVEHLGVTAEAARAKPPRSFTAIMTSPGKGPKREPEAVNPY
jgi:hypothetical protein